MTQCDLLTQPSESLSSSWQKKKIKQYHTPTFLPQSITFYQIKVQSRQTLCTQVEHFLSHHE